MKVNTAVKMIVGAGITAAMYKMVPQIKNMVTNNTSNSSNMSNKQNMSMSSSNKNNSSF